MISIQKLRDMNLHAVADEIEQLREFKPENDRLRAKLAAMESELSSLPAKWSEDSSLETWFPLTSDEMESLREEVSELRAYKEAAEKQEPFRWALDHFALGVGTTLFDREEEAIDFSRSLAGSSRAIPLYAKPVPADKPAVAVPDSLISDIEFVCNAIHNETAMQVCCGRPGQECCGSPDVDWPSWANEAMTKLSSVRDSLIEATQSHSQQSADSVTEGFKVIPDLQHGFNHSAYNRHTGEWVYLNHANTWQLFQGPIAVAPSHSQQSAESDLEIVQKALSGSYASICEDGRWFVEENYDGDPIAKGQGMQSLLTWAKQAVTDRCPSHDSEQLL